MVPDLDFDVLGDKFFNLVMVEAGGPERRWVFFPSSKEETDPLEAPTVETCCSGLLSSTLAIRRLNRFAIPETTGTFETFSEDLIEALSS
jgi:hypothetical protein